MTITHVAPSHKILKRSAMVLLGFAVLGSVAIAAPANKPQTVNQVDLNRYLGTWYEVARFPMYFQRKCASDVTATYGLQANGKVSVLNQCRKANGENMASQGEATPIDKANSKLKVSFLPQGLRWIPFTKGDYWILKLDDNYQTALVGAPNRKYLWILSRTPHLDEQTYQNYVDAAKQQGFDTSKLIRTRHTQ
ncbi:lipocalin family protein [Alkanindiges illinoisensis]|uniref:lipocalin family protein n=1 Tax=Alkanindiges illinoisensis TaxID=197183 RepID=UPI000A9AEF66|nr:lipocalin family protein [Alkanindiges illinoisensis]